MKNLDSLLIMALLWTGWCVLHSLLISSGVTAWMQARLKERFAMYRLGYVLVSIFTVLPVVAFQFMAPQQILFAWSGPWRLLQGLLLGYALLMFYGGFKVYDLQYFMGISQWRAYASGRPQQHMEFTTEGALQYVRHPWYSGGIAIVWAAGPVTDVSLVAKLILTLYLILGTLLEERKLLKEIGEPYRRYQQQVPMLIPALRKRKTREV